MLNKIQANILDTFQIHLTFLQHFLCHLKVYILLKKLSKL